MVGMCPVQEYVVSCVSAGCVRSAYRTISVKLGGLKPKTVPPRYLGQPSPFTHPHLIKHGKYSLQWTAGPVHLPLANGTILMIIKWTNNSVQLLFLTEAPHVCSLLRRWGDSGLEPDRIRAPQTPAGLACRGPVWPSGTLGLLRHPCGRCVVPSDPLHDQWHPLSLPPEPGACLINFISCFAFVGFWLEQEDNTTSGAYCTWCEYLACRRVDCNPICAVITVDSALTYFIFVTFCCRLETCYKFNIVKGFCQLTWSHMFRRTSSTSVASWSPTAPWSFTGRDDQTRPSCSSPAETRGESCGTGLGPGRTGRLLWPA